jgi:hypothetical protein
MNSIREVVEGDARFMLLVRWSVRHTDDPLRLQDKSWRQKDFDGDNPRTTYILPYAELSAETTFVKKCNLS